MSLKIEVVAVGDSLGVQFRLEAGDALLLEEVTDGLELRPAESVEMCAMRRVMRENREVLKRLADS